MILHIWSHWADQGFRSYRLRGKWPRQRNCYQLRGALPAVLWVSPARKMYLSVGWPNWPRSKLCSFMIHHVKSLIIWSSQAQNEFRYLHSFFIVSQHIGLEVLKCELSKVFLPAVAPYYSYNVQPCPTCQTTFFGVRFVSMCKLVKDWKPYEMRPKKPSNLWRNTRWKAWEAALRSAAPESLSSPGGKNDSHDKQLAQIEEKSFQN